MTEDGTTEVATTEQTAQTETAETTQPTSFVADDGTFKDGWREHFLTEDIRDHGTFKDGRIKDVQGLFRSLANAESMIGKDKIARPSESSGDEEWDDFHRAAGWTGEPLPIVAPEGLPEGLWSEERASKFSEKFNELRLNPKQVAGLVEVYNSDLMQQITDMGNNSDTAMATTKAELLAEKGNAYTQFIHNGNAAIAKFADDKGHQDRISDILGNNPDFIRLMGNIGSSVAESGGIPVVKMAPTPGDIDTKIAEVRATEAYNNKRHPEYAAAQANIKRLYEEKNAIKQPV